MNDVTQNDSVFLLHWNGRGPSTVEVLRFDDRKTAEDYSFEVLPGDHTAYVVQNLADLSNRVLFNGPMLLTLVNALSQCEKPVLKFSDLEAGRERVLKVLRTKFNDLPVSELPAAGTEQINKEKEPNVPKEPRVKKAAGAAPKAGKMVQGKPAGKVADFKQVRAGTVRDKLLHAMNGTMTPEEIAEQIGSTPQLVVSHAYCLHRDCAIGYEFLEGRKLRALYPANRTIEDAIKAPKEAEAEAAAA